MSRDRGHHEPRPGLLALGVFAVSLWAQPSALVGVFYDGAARCGQMGETNQGISS